MSCEHILGYYDIQSITIINNGSSNGTVCIQCNYITGADSTGCIVSLSNSNTVYNITITGKNENIIGCIDDVIAGLYSVAVYQIIQQDGAITVVTVLVVGDESVLLGYTRVSNTSSSSMATTSSPLSTGTMYYSTHYNYCYIVGTVAPSTAIHGTSITTTILGNNTLYSVLR